MMLRRNVSRYSAAIRLACSENSSWKRIGLAIRGVVLTSFGFGLLGGCWLMFLKKPFQPLNAGSCRRIIGGKALRVGFGAPPGHCNASRLGMFAPVPTLLPDDALPAEGYAYRREVAS